MPAHVTTATQLVFVDAFGLTALTPPKKVVTLGSSSAKTRQAFGTGWRERLSVDAAATRLLVHQPQAVHIGLVEYALPTLTPLRTFAGTWSAAHLLADGRHCVTTARGAHGGTFALYDLSRHDAARHREYLPPDARVLETSWDALRPRALDAGALDQVGGRRRDAVVSHALPHALAVAPDGAFVHYDGDLGIASVGTLDPSSPERISRVSAVVKLPLWAGYRVAAYPSSTRPLIVAHDAGTSRAHVIPLPLAPGASDALQVFTLLAAGLPARREDALYYQRADALDRIVRHDLSTGREESTQITLEGPVSKRGAAVPTRLEPGVGRVFAGPAPGGVYFLPWSAEVVVDVEARKAIPRKLPEAQATLASAFTEELRRMRVAGRAWGVAVDLESARVQTIRYSKVRSLEHAFYQWSFTPGDGTLESFVLRAALCGGASPRRRLAAALPGLEVGSSNTFFAGEIRLRGTVDETELTRALRWADAHALTLLDWELLLWPAYFEDLGYVETSYNAFAWTPSDRSRAPFTPEAERLLVGVLIDLLRGTTSEPLDDRLARWRTRPATADDVALAWGSLGAFFEAHPTARSGVFVGHAENRTLRWVLQVLITHFGGASRSFLEALRANENGGVREEAQHAITRLALRHVATV